MGVWGWDIAREDVGVWGTLYGGGDGNETSTINMSNGAHGDWDWNIALFPTPDDSWSVVNPQGMQTLSGLLYCEVQPVSQLGRGPAKSDAMCQNYWYHLIGCRACVHGTWVRDRSHDYAGRNIYTPGGSDLGWMEIHPIDGLLAVTDESQPSQRTFEFFAFADDAGLDRLLMPGSGGGVPHSRESRTVSMSWVLFGPGEWQNPSLQVLGEEIRSDGPANYSLSVNGAGELVFAIAVTTGLPVDNEGFYWARFQATWDGNAPGSALALCTVPAVGGLSPEEAGQRVTDAGLVFRVGTQRDANVERPVVGAQWPPTGAVVVSGTTIACDVFIPDPHHPQP